MKHSKSWERILEKFVLSETVSLHYTFLATTLVPSLEQVHNYAYQIFLVKFCQYIHEQCNVHEVSITLKNIKVMILLCCVYDYILLKYLKKFIQLFIVYL